MYLLPTFHNPTGVVLSRERRRAVLELAARYRVPIVESDLYGEKRSPTTSTPRTTGSWYPNSRCRLSPAR